MTILSVCAAVSLTVGGFLFWARRRRSRTWGLCTLATRLEGRLVVVTGGNTGLGAEVCLDLAKRGATVVMASRSWENSKNTLERVRAESGNNDVHYLHLDLANLESVREFSSDLLAKYPGARPILVCNAGVFVPMEQARKTEDGFEIHAGVNHLGHFLLVNLLLDQGATAPSRVVTVSSSLMNQARLDLEGVDHFREGRQLLAGEKKSRAPTGYCDSKMMNALFAVELGKRHRGLVSVGVCPGWCTTQLARHVRMPVFVKLLFAPIAFMFMRSAWRGAQNIIQAVLEDKDNLEQGGFYRECKLATEEMEKLKGKDKDAVKLWEMSLNLTKSSMGNK